MAAEACRPPAIIAFRLELGLATFAALSAHVARRLRLRWATAFDVWKKAGVIGTNIAIFEICQNIRTRNRVGDGKGGDEDEGKDDADGCELHCCSPTAGCWIAGPESGEER